LDESAGNFLNYVWYGRSNFEESGTYKFKGGDSTFWRDSWNIYGGSILISGGYGGSLVEMLF